MSNSREHNKISKVLMFLIPDLRDVLVFGGIASFSYGASLVHHPLGFIVAGLAVFWIGIRR